MAPLLTVSACAGGPEEPQVALAPAIIEDEAIVGGVRLALSSWEPEGAPRAVLLALHGYGDYGPSTYNDAAAYWAEEGILTYAFDQRGFGRNETRGRWPGHEQLVADFADVAALLRARHPDLPFFVAGHSMGGAVALIGAAQGVEADGFIFAAPAVQGGEMLPALWRAAAWSGAFFFPDQRWTGDGVVSIQASDNIEMLRALGRDPYYLAPPSSRELMGLVRLMDEAAEAAGDVSAPALVLYGEKDQVTPKDPVAALYEALNGEKELRLYPEGWHLLFRDLNGPLVWRDVAAWIEARR